MKTPVLVARYAGFALAAVLANLGVQAVVLAARSDALGTAAAMALGTGAGLVLKYVLDKRFIFADPLRGPAHELGRFGRYAGTGLVTTAVFWATEAAFAVAFADPRATLLGGALGLSVGYALKYRLDRRYVFRRAAA